MFTCSSVDGHLDCFYLLDIVNSATVNISVYVFIWTVCSYLLGGVEYAEPYGYSLFNLLRKVKLFSFFFFFLAFVNIFILSCNLLLQKDSLQKKSNGC